MNNGYTEVTLLVGGSLCEVVEMTDDEQFESWLQEVKNEAPDNPSFSYEIWEVYRLTHEHEQDIDCECIQHLADHRPYWTNTDWTLPIY